MENWKEMLGKDATDGMNCIVTLDATSTQARERGLHFCGLALSELGLDNSMDCGVRT
jgi:hypothetical protein